MHTLNTEQIEFVRTDIRRRGIGLDDLHDSLTDHVCCILEEQMDDSRDFRQTYERVIRTFYRDHLWEIEEETLMLLTLKNHDMMKKAMMITGILSAGILATGIFLKFMFLPGAGPMIVSGILSSSFIFLPLLFTTQVKEKESTLEKLVLGLGTAQLFLVSLHVLFKLMHWPGTMGWFYASVVFLLCIYIPVYFFSGIRNPATKTRTIIYAVQMILGGCLVLALYRTPKVERIQAATNTTLFANSQHILDIERRQLIIEKNTTATQSNEFRLSENIYNLCADLKAFILKCETGRETLPVDFEEKNAFIDDNHVGPFFDMDNGAVLKLRELEAAVEKYNQLAGHSAQEKLHVLPSAVINDLVRYDKSATALNMLTQIQFLVLQSERELLAQN